MLEMLYDNLIKELENLNNLLDTYGSLKNKSVSSENVLKYVNGDIIIENVPFENTYQRIWVMPDISSIKVINNKVVIMKFEDGTVEKAVTNDNDTFNLEQGISICLTKRLLDDKQCDGGSSLYNKLVKHALEIYQKNIDKEKKEAEEKAEQEKEERAAQAEREARRIIKEEKQKIKEKEDMEKQINIYKEAYLRAMKEFNQVN